MKNDPIWTSEDAAKAAAQGWELAEVWDQDKRVLHREIFNLAGKHSCDSAARKAVSVQNIKGDALAQKATSMIFNSKVRVKND